MYAKIISEGGEFELPERSVNALEMGVHFGLRPP
jgi:hypothetical protein